MASIPAPVSLPSPVTWWQNPKTRARLIAAAVLAAAYLLGLAYGSWTRVCAGEHCPSISRLIGTGDNVQMQTSKVFAADGRLISELGLERRTVLPLNQIHLGAGAHGVEAAAQIYFGKHARQLNVAEAATLAALPKLPAFYNPRTHPERNVRRRNVVLELMRDQGFLAPEECELWQAYPLVLTTNRTNYGDVAPYFVEWLRSTQLDARFGRDLYEGGLRIYTTLDLEMQEAAERALQSQLDAIEAGVYSNGKFPGRTTYREYIESSKASGEDHGLYTPYLQGALVALEANTGYIRAMIGGRDFDDSKYNRATQAMRQPGSTFKPFVYSAAVRAGHPVTEIVDDSPLNPPVIQLDSTLWQPKDDDDTTLGLIPMREGLYLSRNLATIKLGMALGEQTVIGEARRYGITTPLPPYPSIHIGARGVRPIEMIAAYTAFATLGTRAEPVGVLRVEDRQGNILWQPAIRREPVMDPEHTWLMVDMMKDVIRRGTAFSAVWKAGFTQVPAAGKTGTTDDYTDAWFIGYTPELVTGIWVGYDIQQRILEHNAGGGKIVAPAWTAFMRDDFSSAGVVLEDALLDVVTDPNARHELRRIPDEPGVGVVVGRPGLAGRRDLCEPRFPDGAERRAAADHVLHHVHHEPRVLGIHHGLAADRGLPQDVALPVFHAQHADRLGAGAERGERGIGRDHLDRPHAPGADVDRGIWRQRRGDTVATRLEIGRAHV